ncbi:MAG TPA: DUF87 domain-containing protein, partial [Acidobacteriota bacterium]|nr:DUF87 domain-containing protein [Acidobacteriota bacterium]
MNIIDQIFSHVWNRHLDRRRRSASTQGVDLGRVVSDGRLTERRVALSPQALVRHAAILGKSGSGKSFLLLYLALQLIRKDLGFCFYDLHGEITGQILKLVAQRERDSGQDLSARTILIEPADPECSAGFNVLSRREGLQEFVQAAEFTRILRDRWGLSTFGARTEELLRNSLLALSASGQTLLELPLLLSSYAFRAACLRGDMPPGVRGYFQERFDKATDAMQGAMAGPILNKVTAFTQDPHFRHLLGQRESTFSLAEALEDGSWIILNLSKGTLGEQAATLGSL